MDVSYNYKKPPKVGQLIISIHTEEENDIKQYSDIIDTFFSHILARHGYTFNGRRTNNNKFHVRYIGNTDVISEVINICKKIIMDLAEKDIMKKIVVLTDCIYE